MTAPVAHSAVSQRVAAATEARLRELADAPVFTVFQQLGGSPRGLTEAEAGRPVTTVRPE